MPLEAAQIIPWLALAVSSLVAIRSEWRSRQGTDEGLRAKVEAEIKALRQYIDTQEQVSRQRMEVHHEEIVILKARIGPLLTVMDSRLASMFHQASNEFGLDRLIEKYEADRTDTKESITEAELNTLIFHMHQWYERVKKDGPTPNQSEELASSLWWVLLRGLRDVRRILHQREAREAAEQQQRDEIRAYLRQAKPSFAQQESWWTRLQRYLGGFR